MAKIIVPIEPATLRWAREEMGLDLQQAADKMKKPVEQLRAWESGTQGIRLSDARTLAEKYKVSIQLLYLKKIPDEWRMEKPKDFRRENRQEAYSYQLCMAIRDARIRQSWMREYLKDENEKPLDWVGSFSGQSNITRIANWVLQWLNIDRQKIADFTDDKGALSYWIEKFEDKGIIVSTNGTHAAHKIAHAEYSGLVLYDNYAPLILLNPIDSPARRIFTLIHELAHLLLDNTSGVSQIDFRQQDTSLIETKCNRIASMVLINNAEIRSQWDEKENIEVNIRALVSNLKISHSAIVVKLKELGFIDQTRLDALLDEYHRLYFETQANRSNSGRSVPDKNVLDRCGTLLTKRVLAAYEQGSINATEIYDVLGIKLQHLGKLSKRIEFPLHRWIA